MSQDDFLDEANSELLRAAQRRLDELPVDHPLLHRLVEGLVATSGEIDEADASHDTAIERFDRQMRRRFACIRLSRLIAGRTGALTDIAQTVRALIADAFEPRQNMALARDGAATVIAELDEDLAAAAGVRRSFSVARDDAAVTVTFSRRSGAVATLAVLISAGTADPVVGLTDVVDDLTARVTIAGIDPTADMTVHVLVVDDGEGTGEQE